MISMCVSAFRKKCLMSNINIFQILDILEHRILSILQKCISSLGKTKCAYKVLSFHYASFILSA